MPEDLSILSILAIYGAISVVALGILIVLDTLELAEPDNNEAIFAVAFWPLFLILALFTVCEWAWIRLRTVLAPTHTPNKDIKTPK